MRGNPNRPPDELAAMRRLIDHFGADIALELRAPLPREPRVRAALRMAVEEEIERRYLERNEHIFPIYPRWSPSRLERDGRIAIIGPSPAWEDHKHGELGWSRAARALTQQLRKDGIHPDRVSELTTVFHWTTNGEPKGNRAPTPAEQDEARADLFDALDAADVEYVLLHGLHAVKAWRVDVKMTEVVGGLYLMHNRWLVYPINHATAVLRQDGYDAAEWRRQLAQFVEHVENGSGFDVFRESCIKNLSTGSGCSGGFYAWDEDGVPWCSAHYDEGRKGVKKHAKRDAKRHAARQQGLGI